MPGNAFASKTVRILCLERAYGSSHLFSKAIGSLITMHHRDTFLPCQALLICTSHVLLVPINPGLRVWRENPVGCIANAEVHLWRIFHPQTPTCTSLTTFAGKPVEGPTLRLRLSEVSKPAGCLTAEAYTQLMQLVTTVRQSSCTQ